MIKAQPLPLYCIVDSHHGIYAGQFLAQSLDWTQFTGHSQDDIDILLSGPDHPEYCEALESLLSTAIHTDDQGNTYQLIQDMDIWLVCPELMTDYQKLEFGFED